MGWDTRRPASGFSYFLIFLEGRRTAVRGRQRCPPGAPGLYRSPRAPAADEIYATANRGADDRWPNRGQAGPSGVRAGGRVGLAAASAALKRKPKATAAAPVLVLAVAVRPQPASQRIFLFSYFLGDDFQAAFLICFFLKYEGPL